LSEKLQKKRQEIKVIAYVVRSLDLPLNETQDQNTGYKDEQNKVALRAHSLEGEMDKQRHQWK
jgi:hypothetical protein